MVRFKIGIFVVLAVASMPYEPARAQALGAVYYAQNLHCMSTTSTTPAPIPELEVMVPAGTATTHYALVTLNLPDAVVGAPSGRQVPSAAFVWIAAAGKLLAKSQVYVGVNVTVKVPLTTAAQEIGASWAVEPPATEITSCTTKNLPGPKSFASLSAILSNF